MNSRVKQSTLKLLYCASCEYIFTVKEKSKTCHCGKVSGFLKGTTTHYSGPAIAFVLYNFVHLASNNIDLSAKEIQDKYSPEDKLFATKVIEYLNQKAGTKFLTNFPSTSAKLILERRKEHNVGLEEFFKVIDKKCAKWLHTEYQEYLRPVTLFNKTKFENYLGEISFKQINTTGTGKVITEFASSVSAAKK